MIALSKLGGGPMITLLFTWLLSFSASANDCSCIYKSGQAKQITESKNHWWGTSITYYCDYTCSFNGESFVYRANHKTWWTGDEEGNEFVCDGTIYEQKYSANSGWFYYSYVGSKNFQPKNSSSKDLKTWAREQNCQ